MSTNEKSEDVEAPLLNPLSMKENPAFWSFIRKVYAIIAVQLLSTVAVAAAVATHPSVATFFRTTWGGWIVYALIVLFVCFVMFLLSVFKSTPPINFLLLLIFTLSFGLVTGFTASFFDAIIILEASIATAVVVVTLTLYTFWAAWRGQEFGSFKPFGWTLLITIVLFIIYQIWFPMEKVSGMLYDGLFVVVFSIYVVYYTNVLMKRNTYDQYIWCSITLYLDILNLLLRLITALGKAKRAERPPIPNPR